MEREEKLAQGREEGRAEGRAEGIVEGRTEGEMLKLIRQTYKKWTKNYTAAETADMLEEDIEIVRRIYEAIETVKTDEVDEIYEQFLKYGCFVIV